jgi:hypothetical protein
MTATPHEQMPNWDEEYKLAEDNLWGAAREVPDDALYELQIQMMTLSSQLARTGHVHAAFVADQFVDLLRRETDRRTDLLAHANYEIDGPDVDKND